MDMKVLYIELYVSFLLGAFVYALYELFKVEKEKAESEETQKPGARRPTPTLSLPPGIITIFVGVFAFCASAAVERIVHTGEASNVAVTLITGVLNPFFFIGVPLGIYRLSKSKSQKKRPSA